jgi:hypothetical protein
MPPPVLTPGASEEARALLDAWNAQWPGIPASGWGPREVRPGNWVRFHTLPDSRQSLRHRRDARTAFRRFRSIVGSVEQVSGMSATVLLADYPSWPGERLDRTRSVLPELKSWITYPVPTIDPRLDDEGDAFEPEPSTQLVRLGPVEDDLLLAWLLLVHSFEVDFLLLPEDLSWAVSLYDGGVDVVTKHPDEAATLAHHLGRWLPPDGWTGFAPWVRKASQRELHRGLDTA